MTQNKNNETLHSLFTRRSLFVTMKHSGVTMIIIQTSLIRIVGKRDIYMPCFSSHQSSQHYYLSIVRWSHALFVLLLFNFIRLRSHRIESVMVLLDTLSEWTHKINYEYLHTSFHCRLDVAQSNLIRCFKSKKK